VPSLALAYAEDEGVRAIAKQHQNFRSYLDQFTTEFGDKVLPSTAVDQLREGWSYSIDLGRWQSGELPVLVTGFTTPETST
jgi:hypothetical protein